MIGSQSWRLNALEFTIVKLYRLPHLDLCFSCELCSLPLKHVGRKALELQVEYCMQVNSNTIGGDCLVVVPSPRLLVPLCPLLSNSPEVRHHSAGALSYQGRTKS